MPLRELFLVTAVAVIVNIVRRQALQEGIKQGEKNAEQHVQLAFYRGAAKVRLDQARNVDILTEMHKLR